MYKSEIFKVPVITVGNLSMGGTGKTPMVEYLIRLLQDEYKIAVLSRGYKRATKGFVLANEKSTVRDLGDEPYQYFSKFKNIKVAVDADRRNGIKEILKLHPEIDVVILDDAFQHRWVKPTFSILLTSYGKLYSEDYIVPVGNLRESRKGAKRADVVVVTKCPSKFSDQEAEKIKKQLNFKKQKNIFFSKISYAQNIVSATNKISLSKLTDFEVLLVTGIANPKPLAKFLQDKNIQFTQMNFPDHHNFSADDLETIQSAFVKLNSDKKIILTTEKDFTRLQNKMQNLYYLAIQSEVSSKVFDSEVLKVFS